MVAYSGSGCRVESEVSDGRKRTDLVVEGEEVEGKIAMVVSVVAISGLNEPNQTVNEDESLKLKTREKLQLPMRSRIIQKLKKYEGCSFGGKLTPFVVSAGGFVEKKYDMLLRRLKLMSPKYYSQLKINLSCYLSKSRGRSFVKSFA